MDPEHDEAERDLPDNLLFDALKGFFWLAAAVFAGVLWVWTIRAAVMLLAG